MLQMCLISEVIKNTWKAWNVNAVCKQPAGQEVSTYYTDISTLANEQELIIVSTVHPHKYRNACVPKMLAVTNHKCF